MISVVHISMGGYNNPAILNAAGGNVDNTARLTRPLMHCYNFVLNPLGSCRQQSCKNKALSIPLFVLEGQFTFRIYKVALINPTASSFPGQGGGHHAPRNAFHRKYASFIHDR